jgi:small-conductance mechanosensitive channel
MNELNPALEEVGSSLTGLAEGFIAFLPRLSVALVVFAVFLMAAAGARALTGRFAYRRQVDEGARHNLAVALSRLVQGLTVLLGVFVAFTVAFPSFTPGDLVSALGLGGVAIGFAFKDIFQNYLAGILILATRPFVVGDQVRFKEFEGEVENILARATYITTYDGRRVVIPNSDLYTDALVVNTAFATRRWQYDIGIGYGDDIETARRIILQTLVAAEDVLPDPKADVILVELAPSTVNLRARWWTSSRMADGLNAQDRVLTRVKRALTEAGIDLPFPTQQLLVHDQTETADGDRGRQREGWPAGSGPVPGPRPRVKPPRSRQGQDGGQ